MAIGNPTAIAADNFAAPGALTTNSTAAPGSLILVAVLAAATNSSLAAVTMSDNATGGSNTYVNVVNVPPVATLYSCGIFAVIGSTNNLPSGSVITPAGTNGITSYLAAYAATGCNGGVDQTNTHEVASSTSFSLATGVLAIANELLFGVGYFAAAQGAYTEGSGFTALTGSGSGQDMAYSIVSSTSSVNWAPSWINSVGNTASIATFKITASASSSSGNIPLLGVSNMIGWRAPLFGAAAWKFGKAIVKNGIIARRRLLLLK